MYCRWVGHLQAACAQCSPKNAFSLRRNFGMNWTEVLKLLLKKGTHPSIDLNYPLLNFSKANKLVWDGCCVNFTLYCTFNDPPQNKINHIRLSHESNSDKVKAINLTNMGAFPVIPAVLTYKILNYGQKPCFVLQWPSDWYFHLKLCGRW